MKKMTNKFLFLFFVTAFGLSLPFFTNGQSGGDFTITKSVISSGGGVSSDNGNIFSITSANGQATAGTRMSNPPFSIGTGFFPPPPFTQTAAGVMIRGLVLNADKNGIKNAVLTLTGGTLIVPRVAVTNQFGYFAFDNVEVGQFYVISVQHKNYIFNQNTQSLTLFEDVDDMIFRADFEN